MLLFIDLEGPTDEPDLEVTVLERIVSAIVFSCRNPDCFEALIDSFIIHFEKSQLLVVVILLEHSYDLMCEEIDIPIYLSVVGNNQLVFLHGETLLE